MSQGWCLLQDMQPFPWLYLYSISWQNKWNPLKWMTWAKKSIKILSSRWPNYQTNQDYAVPAHLDPRFKDFAFTDEDAKAKAGNEIISLLVHNHKGRNRPLIHQRLQTQVMLTHLQSQLIWLPVHQTVGPSLIGWWLKKQKKKLTEMNSL